MIYIVTAMFAEAHPFIARFQLKKEISHTRFQVFRNDEADICLIISGVGSIPAAVAVGSICAQYGAEQGDFLLNVGVCGQIWNKNIHRTESTFGAGKIFLCNKIQEQATGRTFYPDILYRHRFAEAQLVTGARPYSKSEAGKMLKEDEMTAEDFYLYDMEAAAVCQAGAYYFGPHQMSFLKITSDDGNTENVTSVQIEHLIDLNMDSLSSYIEVLQNIAQKERQRQAFQMDEAQKAAEKLCRDTHCSRAMSESVRQHIRYCVLSGTDYASVLDEMYRSGILPCIDKREGKRRLEELRKQLL